MQAYACDHSITSHITVRCQFEELVVCLMVMDRQYLLSIRYPAEPERHRDLDEQADRRKSVTSQTWIAKALYYSRAISVETARRSTIDYTYHNMDPK